LFNALLFNPIQERSFILMSAIQTLLPTKSETLNKNHVFTIRSFIGKPACGDQNIAVIFCDSMFTHASVSASCRVYVFPCAKFRIFRPKISFTDFKIRGKILFLIRRTVAHKDHFDNSKGVVKLKG